MRRTAVLTTAALSAASGIAVLLRRLMRPGGPVRVALADGAQGAGGSRLPAWRRSLPVTPVPGNVVTATTEVEEAQGPRTWVVDGSASWDGSPGEQVRPIRPEAADPQHGKQHQRHRPM